MPFATTTIVSSHKSVPGRSRHKRHEAFSKTQNFYLASREIQTMRGDGLLSPHVVTHISNFAASCSLKFQSVTIADRDQQRSASPESPRHAFAEFSARIRSESRCIHPLSPSLPPRVRARARVRRCPQSIGTRRCVPASANVITRAGPRFPVLIK